jgi:hypothetical protein
MTLRSISAIGILLFISAFSSCKNNNRQTLLGGICDTTNTKFATVIYPIIITHCNTQSGCHGASPGSISLEGYDNIKAAYPSILEQIKSGNMPKGASALDLCTITKIQTWVNRGANNN